ncbi:MAG TPA: bacteriohemerythrin [Rhodospirillaceae bacterium]|nr:bacteriohemerythrin [Rhodospirillaceae bacterium]
MQFFYWNKSFEIGIEAIDHQHHRLVDLINGLAMALTEGRKLPQVQVLFGQLMEYAAEHFRDEERIIDTAPLPKAEKTRHKKAHQGFVEKAQEVTRRSDLLDAEVAEQTLDFLTTWLISHILGSDKKYADVLRPDGKNPPQAKGPFAISPVERVLVGALSETERRFRLISDHTPALIWVSDTKGDRGYFNRAWSDFVGIDEDRALSVDWTQFIHPEDLLGYQMVNRQIVEHPQPTETEYRLRRHDGEYRWHLERILPRMESNDLLMGFIASATDISVIKQAESLLDQAKTDMEQEISRRTAHLEKLIITDPLTGVGNRRFLESRLHEEAVRARRYQHPLSAVFFDVDFFKRINDAYGHAMGDRVIAGVAAGLKSCLRECDLIARYGGEEFVVLLVETSLETAIPLVERMRSAVGQIPFDGMQDPISISAGIAELKPDENGNGLLERCDRALYQAKHSGRNCYKVDPG